MRSPESRLAMGRNDGHLCYANNSTDQELLGIGQFDEHFDAESGHGHWPHRAAFNNDVSRA